MQRRMIPGVLIGMLVFVYGCSRDPHKIVISEKHQDDFTTLVKGSPISGEELALLKDAQTRLQKFHPRTIVGKTIGEVITDQRNWRAARQQINSKFELVYRSAKATQSAVSVGVTYLKYGELLQSFATELNVVKDKLSTEEERHICELFQSTLQTYQDAGTLWQHQIDNSRYEDLYRGGVGYSLKGVGPEPELKRIAETYNIPVHSGQLEYGQGPFQSLPKNSMQFVWLVADMKIAPAVEAYTAN